MERISKENYYLDIAQTVAARSTCLRRKFGAIIVSNDSIVSTGYNGAPRGRKNCSDLGTCMREELHIPRGERYELCRSVHAEQNAIIQAAHLGQSIAGGTLYCTNQPCVICAKMIINAGIKEVVYKQRYSIDSTSMRLLAEAGVKVRALEEE